MNGSVRRMQRGTSLIEVLIAGAVLTIGIAGVAVSVVYQQSLETSTARLWESTCDATAQMEILRAAGESNFAGLKANHDGRTIETSMLYTAGDADIAAVDVMPSDYTISGGGTLTISDGRSYVEGEYTLDSDGCPIVDGVRLQMRVANIADIAGNQLLVRIIDDPDMLDDGELMWTPASPAPNFYAIEVSTATRAGEFSNRLRLQTYVSDQSDLDRGSTGLVDGSGGNGFEFGFYRDALDRYATAPAVSGTDSEIFSFNLTNVSATALPVATVRVQVQGAGDFVEMSIAGVDVYAGAAVSTYEGPVDLLLPSGDFEIRVVGDPGSNGADAPFTGANITLRFTFEDGSSADIQVTP